MCASSKNERPQVRRSREENAATKVLQFVLYKENRDTMAAVSTIAKQLYLKPHAFAFAGTKDKRGQTSQLVTCAARGMTARKVLAGLRFPELRAGNFEYVDAPMRLGQLRGNRFTIVLRDVTAVAPTMTPPTPTTADADASSSLNADSASLAESSSASSSTAAALPAFDEATLAAAASAVAADGFINYFGLQRFGTSECATHRIGRALLRREFALAAHLILAPRYGLSVETRTHTEHDWTDDICSLHCLILPVWSFPLHFILFPCFHTLVSFF
jgi:tRNA pseudouridine13 synthase